MKPFRLLSLLVLMLLIGCGGSQPQTVVTISPKPASITAGQQLTFTASIAVNWALSGAGKLTSVTPLQVTYIAPAGVPPNASVTLTAAAQADSTAKDSDTFTITTGSGISGNNYIGAQSPGDVWLFTLNDVNNQFSADNQTTGLNYAGTTVALPNGLLKTSITTSNDPALPPGSSGYAVEVPGVAAMLALGGGTGKPVALVAQSPCPSLSSPANVQVINLGKSTYDSAVSESYAAVVASQSGSTYNVSVNSYLLDGTLRTSQSGALPSGTCASGVVSIPNVPTGSGSTTVTVAPAANGLYIIDLGPGRGAAVGSQTFAVDSATLNAAMSASYLGAIFRRNSTPITTFAGFGPGSGTSITGGAFANPDTDAFSAHATNVTLNFTSVNSNGFLQGDVTDSATGLTHTPFVGMVTQNAGKFFIFGITTDTSTTTPYVILLSQH